MRGVKLIVGTMMLASGLSLAQAKPATQPPQDPSERFRVRADRASKQECAKVCFEAAAQVAEAANQRFDKGDVEVGQKWMKDAVAYARKGTEASIETRKRQKDAEIALRKLSKRIRDIGDSLAFDDRAPVYEDSKVVADLRDQMLSSIFGSPKKSLEGKKK